jgi:hypothetical protein
LSSFGIDRPRRIKPLLGQERPQTARINLKAHSYVTHVGASDVPFIANTLSFQKMGISFLDPNVCKIVGAHKIQEPAGQPKSLASSGKLKSLASK